MNRLRKSVLLACCAAFAHPAMAQPLPASTLPQDLSFWGMVHHADWVVKAVLAGLAFASVLTWTIALSKGIEMLIAGRQARAGLRILEGVRSLAAAQTELRGQPGACARLVHVATTEVDTGSPQEGAQERASWRLDRVVARSARALSRGTGVLATIGATAPFVGLFGTVWGIMNSFIGISRTQTTNLAVVAPGIAEALLATAIGLVAAIPAVVIYNLFARGNATYRALLADAVTEVMALLSRDLARETR